MNERDFIEKLYHLCLSGPIAKEELREQLLPKLERYRELAGTPGPGKRKQLQELFRETVEIMNDFFQDSEA